MGSLGGAVVAGQMPVVSLLAETPTAREDQLMQLQVSSKSDLWLWTQSQFSSVGFWLLEPNEAEHQHSCKLLNNPLLSMLTICGNTAARHSFLISQVWLFCMCLLSLLTLSPSVLGNLKDAVISSSACSSYTWGSDNGDGSWTLLHPFLINFCQTAYTLVHVNTQLISLGNKYTLCVKQTTRIVKFEKYDYADWCALARAAVRSGWWASSECLRKS